MGFWKKVSMDVARGVSVEKATALNAEQMYGEVLIEYCVIPYYDGVLEAHSMTNNHV